MRLRAPDETHAWRGMRYVPLGLTVSAKERAQGATPAR
jgi:hypothetical protein